MFEKKDLVYNLNRDLDRARDKRDALTSDISTLTAQIAELEACLSEEKDRRDRERVEGEIEMIKKRLKDSSTAFAHVIATFCDATEAAAAVVLEARELNSFLLSIATEVDTVIDPLLSKLNRRAEAVRAGHAALDLPQLANEPQKNNYRVLRLPAWLLSKPKWTRISIVGTGQEDSGSPKEFDTLSCAG